MDTTAVEANGVAVYCAASIGTRDQYLHAAVSVGKTIAKASRTLVYGGGAQGLMGAVSASALQHGGEVVGIIPYAIVKAGGEKKDGYAVEPDREKYGDKVETIIVNSMHERKVAMTRRVRGFIALPGGFGTWEEVMEAITWTQLGIHHKPVILLNVLGFYDPMRALLKNGIEAGLIQPYNAELVVFVDGPSDQSQHGTFDWGAAALAELDGWKGPGRKAFAFDWTTKMPDEDGRSGTQTPLQAT